VGKDAIGNYWLVVVLRDVQEILDSEVWLWRGPRVLAHYLFNQSFLGRFPFHLYKIGDVPAFRDAREAYNFYLSGCPPKQGRGLFSVLNACLIVVLDNDDVLAFQGIKDVMLLLLPWQLSRTHGAARCGQAQGFKRLNVLFPFDKEEVRFVFDTW